MKVNENEIFREIVAHPGQSRITNHTQTSPSCSALSPHPLTCNSVTPHTNRRKALLWGTGWQQLCGDFHKRSRGKSNYICTWALPANPAEALRQEHTGKSQTRAHAEDKKNTLSPWTNQIHPRRRNQPINLHNNGRIKVKKIQKPHSHSLITTTDNRASHHAQTVSCNNILQEWL